MLLANRPPRHHVQVAFQHCVRVICLCVCPLRLQRVVWDALHPLPTQGGALLTLVAWHGETGPTVKRKKVGCPSGVHVCGVGRGCLRRLSLGSDRVRESEPVEQQTTCSITVLAQNGQWHPESGQWRDSPGERRARSLGPTRALGASAVGFFFLVRRSVDERAGTANATSAFHRAVRRPIDCEADLRAGRVSASLPSL